MYDKYINGVGWKYNIIFFDSEWILFSCTVIFFWKDSAFNFEYGRETENAYLCKLSISQRGEKRSAGENGLKLRSRCKGV